MLKVFRQRLFLPFTPLLSINFLANGKFLKHSTEGFLYEMFRYCATKQFRQKFVIRATLAYVPDFSIPETFWNTERILYGMFRYCETKQFRQKLVIPPSLSSIKVFDPRKFPEDRLVPLRCFSVL